VLPPFPALLTSLLAAAPLTGQVRLVHPPPPRPALKVTGDASACGTTKADESLTVTAKGEVEGAIVFIANPPPTTGEAPSPKTVHLDQVGCRFVPHVLAAQVGAKLDAANSDPVLHTVHATDAGKHFVFDEALPRQGLHRMVPLARKGLFALSCSANHPWMHGWLRVFDHPYFAVTDAHGRFSLPALPPGHYDLVVWQERLGESHRPLEIQGAKVHPLTLTLDEEQR
jgi:hypothetical protein